MMYLLFNLHCAGFPRRLIDPARWGDEEGSTTAEFAMVTLAAVAFAGLLIAILSSGDVRGMLMSLVQRALSI